MGVVVMDELDSAAVRGKISLLPGFDSELSAVTFCLLEEDHTLGNALRYMLMKDPRVEFCGYTLPHPSENKIHMRVQMYGECCFALPSQDDIFHARALSMTGIYATNCSS